MVGIASVLTDSGERPAVVHPHRGVALVERLAPQLRGDLMTVLDGEVSELLERRAAEADDTAFRPTHEVRFTAPYRAPAKIWGIGLNYLDHAGDLKSALPDEPGSFLKANHTIIGPGEDIVLPAPELTDRVTAEAELGIVIGKYCRNVSEAEALDYVWGLTPILDQTAEDLVLRNPRFLTRSKNFPTFFSFGPVVIPMQQVRKSFATLDEIEVRTVKNGEVTNQNVVANMKFSPAYLISFHSRVMPLYPGDIISPGTPGATLLADGDVVGCHIPGIGTLENRVRRARQGE
jgi:2-keto-4-pentenoate hydratase/2-oxohepta-3-ene-1,7-dioic acid hydratase in catechol pathway